MKTLILLCLLITSASVAFAQQPDVEKKLKELGLQLPLNQKPIANYVKAVRSGNLVFLSGQGPASMDGKLLAGKVGKDMTVEQGYDAAKLTGLSLLSSLKDEIGDLNKVKRIVKVLGMVNCGENFTDHPKVINGFDGCCFWRKRKTCPFGCGHEFSSF
ncbi:RidA family protein [Dyadobacter sp. 3J3]|uniref:RidA family protein n=1 Tax=Dyadobacter sp. 3J3 TaxID=2606600 RepID=UPI00286E8321|nr:RidA family protein [Dyadobacter sp. 3J3]